MELSEQQALYNELEKLVKNKSKNQEFCLYIAVESGGIGSGNCSAFTITSLGNLSSLGSWKGIANSMNNLNSGFTSTYYDPSAPAAYLPIKPKT